jgi:iron-sulfur cluster insertion protein
MNNNITMDWVKWVNNNMIKLTPNAIYKIKDILAEENNPSMRVRTFVQGGGCSGMSYGFTLDEEQNEDDYIIDGTDGLMLIDSMSMQYLSGSTIDYKEDLTGSNFSVNNPNAQTTCGCGSSFSV